MAEPFPRASPGVPPVAMALRLGAGPAKAPPTRRSVRRIFPAAHVAGKNDSDSFRLAPETRKGNPLPGPFPGGRGTKVSGQLPASIGVPAIRLAAWRLCRWKGRCGGRTGVPGRLLASVRSACCPPGRGAASAAEGPLRRQDEGPRSAACFYWKCLRSGSPLGGFAGERLPVLRG